MRLDSKTTTGKHRKCDSIYGELQLETRIICVSFGPMVPGSAYKWNGSEQASGRSSQLGLC